MVNDPSPRLDAEELRRRTAEAVARFNAMSPVNQALHSDEQRRSFVRGQSGRDPGPSVLAEEVRRLRALTQPAEEGSDQRAGGAQQEWRPIEEAPRDGTHVLLAFEAGRALDVLAERHGTIKAALEAAILTAAGLSVSLRLPRAIKG